MQNNTASRNVQDRVFTSSKVISKFDQRVFSHNSKQKKQTDAFYEVMGQSQRLRNDIVKNELSGPKKGSLTRKLSENSEKLAMEVTIGIRDEHEVYHLQ